MNVVYLISLVKIKVPFIICWFFSICWCWLFYSVDYATVTQLQQLFFYDWYINVVYLINSCPKKLKLQSKFVASFRYVSFASSAGPPRRMTATMLLLLLLKIYTAHFFKSRLCRYRTKRGILCSYCVQLEGWFEEYNFIQKLPMIVTIRHALQTASQKRPFRSNNRAEVKKIWMYGLKKWNWCYCRLAL